MGISRKAHRPKSPRCPSCSRKFGAGEKRSSYAGVDVCAGCAAIQKAGDALELVADLTHKLSELSYRVPV